MKKETEAMRLGPGAPTDDAHPTAQEHVRPGAGGVDKDLMHRAMAWAIMELRRRRQWRQEDLARMGGGVPDEEG